ncbi:MAG: RagB/SusD family nutrient uptake outer membrane protein, partial [Bacteroidota bacterium]
MKHNVIYLIALCLLLVSCDEDEFLEEDVRDAIAAENLFVDYDGFFSGMNSVYANMRLIKGAGASMSRDQVWVVNTDVVSSRSDGVFNYSELGVTYEEFEKVFEWCYEIINTTNLIINRAEGDDIDWGGSSLEEASGNKNTIISEARVARSWAYRLLIYAFGPVPLSVEEVTGANFTNAWSRNSIEEIKAQMQEDL